MAMFCCLRSDRGEIMVNKVGFSISGFFFSFIWAFANKIHNYAIISFSIFIFCYALFLSSLLSGYLFILSFLLTSIFWGIFGNNILICKLIGTGFNPEILLNSRNSKEALIIFLSKND